MARYEGMEDLLDHVRSHVQMADAPQIDIGRSQPVLQPVMQTPNPDYTDAIERVMCLLRDSEQLREALSPVRIRDLTREQLDEVHVLLDRALKELARCEAVLQRVPGRE